MADVSAPLSPEVAEYEARNARMREMLLSSGKNRQKKDKKKVDPENLEHVKFQREVEQGLYQPSPEQIEQLVLVPHFESIHFHNFGQAKQPKKQKKEKDMHRVKDISAAEQSKMRRRARRQAIRAYRQRVKQPVHMKAQSSESKDEETTINLELKDESYDVLKRAVRELSKEVDMIERQNKILVAHLQLLDKAKQRLDCTATCSVEAIQWERQLIEEYYAAHPEAKRMIPRRKSRKFLAIQPDGELAELFAKSSSAK